MVTSDTAICLDITIELRTHFHFIKKTKSLTDFFCHCQGAEENRNLCLQEGLTSVELTYVDNDITTEVMSFGFTPLRRLKSEVKFTLHHWITLLLWLEIYLIVKYWKFSVKCLFI